jgi:general stress protein 26
VWYEKGCDDPRIQLLIRSNVTAGNTFKNVKEDGRASDERA